MHGREKKNKRKTDPDTIRSPLFIRSFRGKRWGRRRRGKTEGWERAIRGGGEKQNFEKSDLVESDFDANLPLPAVVFDENPSRGLYRTLATKDNAVPSPLVWSKTDRHTGKHNVYSNRVSLSLFLQRREGEEKKRKINELALVQANRCETIRVCFADSIFASTIFHIPSPL